MAEGHHHPSIKSSAAQIGRRIDAARDLAAAQGKSLTPQREAVLRLLLEAGQPLGAYELMARLGAAQDKPVAPPTIYRALDFLLELGVIARIESRNEFLPCAHPGEEHDCMFLVCTCCGAATEIDGEPLAAGIDRAAQDIGFAPARRMVEIRGLCANCH